MTTFIDLRQCVENDILISKHGMVLRYKRHVPDNAYEHEVIYPNGSFGSRINDGHVFFNNRLPSDHDIVAVIRGGQVLQQKIWS